MGSSDSSCCGSNTSQVRREFGSTIKRKKNTKGNTSKLGEFGIRDGNISSDSDNEPDYIIDINGDQIDENNQRIKEIPECVLSKDLNKCAALARIICVIKSYNIWLKENELIETKKTGKNKKLRGIDPQSTNYKQYHKEIEELIIKSVDYYSIKLFLADCFHIKRSHHYHYNELREVIISSLDKRSRECLNDNCWSMKHYFLSDKEIPKRGHRYNRLKDPLEILTNLHVFMFHSVYISEFRCQSVHPRNIYLCSTYCERKIRKLNIKIYQNNRDKKEDEDKIFPIKVMHLICLYHGAKYIEDDDTLDKVSPLALSEFIEKTMNKATLAKVWKKLDEDGSDTIDKDEVDGILLLTVILLVATDFKDSGVTGKPKIDKGELKELMKPIGSWMKKYKMIQQPVITKNEFRDTFSKWLKEYHDTNGGIIADKQEQLKMLKKYKINDDKNGLLDGFKSKRRMSVHDRLVINCEYLKEHISSMDISGKDDSDNDDIQTPTLPNTNSSVEASLNPDAKSFRMLNT